MLSKWEGNMNNQRNDMKTIQERGLMILIEVDKICKKHNIRYFLEAGTLLGAVRHKGFIPWDDDVDVAMLRDDLESFLEIAQEELPKKYFVQTNDTDPNFPFGFTRIIDTKSVFHDNESKYRTGFCLDVLPIDNADDNIYRHKLNIFMIKIIQGLSKSKIVLDMSNYKGPAIKMVVRMTSLVGNLFSTRLLMNMQKKIATLNNHKDTQYKCFYSYPFGYLNYLFPSKIYIEDEMLEFEGNMFPVPKGWSEALTILFGDYMTPPPMDKRVPMHGYENVEFLDD